MPSPSRLCLGLVCAVSISACDASPSQDILGSFFPSWMLCGLVGIVSAVAFRGLLGVAGLNQVLLAPALIYLCFAVAVALLTWLLCFAG